MSDQVATEMALLAFPGFKLSKAKVLQKIDLSEKEVEDTSRIGKRNSCSKCKFAKNRNHLEFPSPSKIFQKTLSKNHPFSHLGFVSSGFGCRFNFNGGLWLRPLGRLACSLLDLRRHHRSNLFLGAEPNSLFFAWQLWNFVQCPDLHLPAGHGKVDNLTAILCTQGLESWPTMSMKNWTSQGAISVNSCLRLPWTWRIYHQTDASLAGFNRKNLALMTPLLNILIILATTAATAKKLGCKYATHKMDCQKGIQDGCQTHRIED